MKQIFLSAAALGALSVASFAADLPSRSAPLLAPAPQFSWTGAYVGAHAGYLWSDVKVAYEGENGGGDLKGFLGGALAGYNWQRGDWVYGVEGDAAFGNVKGTGCSPFPDCRAGSGLGSKIYTYKMEWNAHLRGRVGYAMDSILVFVAGGMSAAHHKLGEMPENTLWNNLDPSLAETYRTKTHFGWSVGGGVEKAWSKSFITRVEYIYDDYGRKTYDQAEGTKIRLTGQTVRSALIYKF